MRVRISIWSVPIIPKPLYSEGIADRINSQPRKYCLMKRRIKSFSVLNSKRAKARKPEASIKDDFEAMEHELHLEYFDLFRRLVTSLPEFNLNGLKSSVPFTFENIL